VCVERLGGSAHKKMGFARAIPHPPPSGPLLNLEAAMGGMHAGDFFLSRPEVGKILRAKVGFARRDVHN
jgi:hypothetical protein